MTSSIAPTPPVVAAVPSQRRAGATAGAVLVWAVAVGLAWGAATSVLQTVLPSPWSALANAVSPWVAPAFLVGATARRPGPAVAAGVLACWGEVAGYYGLSALRGFGVNPVWVVAWSVTALPGGAVFATAGWLWRRGPVVRRCWPALGAAAMACVFLAEGAVLHGHLLHHTGEAVLSCAIGAVLLVVLGATAHRPLDGPRPARSRRGALGATAAWALLVLPLAALAELALPALLP